MATSIGKAIHKYFLLNYTFFRTPADDQLKWIPFGAVFFLDALGVPSRTGWKKQVLIMSAAEAIKYLISDNLKKLTHEHRPAPYEGSRHSFPSGHSCTSFSTAEFLHAEFKESLPVLSCAGYVAATTVAAIRVIKNRHWLRDVIAGAVIGIVATRLAYALIDRQKAQPVNMDDVETGKKPELVQERIKQAAKRRTN